jgi:hypothetical protein
MHSNIAAGMNIRNACGGDVVIPVADVDPIP